MTETDISVVSRIAEAEADTAAHTNTTPRIPEPSVASHDYCTMAEAVANKRAGNASISSVRRAA